MQRLNKRARFDYILEPEHIEAGLALTGSEAKSIREGRADISKSVVRIINGEAWFLNANIPAEGIKNPDPLRSRKLLLHGAEILAIQTKMKQRKLTLVPLKLYTKGRLVKLDLALGKPKRKFEKRQAIKAKDLERDMAQELRHK